MLDPYRLKSFLAVAAALSFRKAAQALHCAPSTVTCQVRNLEQELGVALFERSSRQVRLTRHGMRLVPSARRIVELLEQAAQLAADGDGGDAELAVRISGTLGSHCLPGVLPRFRKLHPETRLTLATHSRHGLRRDLRHGVMDLALILGEAEATAGLRVEHLGRERLVVAVAPDSPLARLVDVGPEDLAGQQLVLTEHVWSQRRRMELALLEAGARPSCVVECASLEMVKALVLAGQGVSVVPEFSVRGQAARGELSLLEWRGGGLFAPVLLLSGGEGGLSPAATDFAALLREFFRTGAGGGKGVASPPAGPAGG